jgi:nicotinamidase-related amidase
MEIAENAALVVVDVQKGFDEADFWGTRNNPEADDNIASLIDVWQSTGRPVVFVRHDSS